VRHGELWIADLPLEIKRRPVLILSRDKMPARREEITVAYVTSKKRYPGVEVLLTPADGVDQECVVNLDSINTIPKRWLERRIGKLSSAQMRQVSNAIRFALDLT
jgi:mRNA interferase MazF